MKPDRLTKRRGNEEELVYGAVMKFIDSSSSNIRTGSAHSCFPFRRPAQRESNAPEAFHPRNLQAWRSRSSFSLNLDRKRTHS